VTTGPLARLTDRASRVVGGSEPEERIGQATPEELYKLGFLNGIQACVIGATDDGQRELTTAAIQEAVELMEGT
jgi:hypothetical protein